MVFIVGICFSNTDFEVVKAYIRTDWYLIPVEFNISCLPACDASAISSEGWYICVYQFQCAIWNIVFVLWTIAC